MIQGYKLTNNLTSMDFNRSCTHFATGGKESITYSIKILPLLASIWEISAGSENKKLMESIGGPVRPGQMSVS